MVADEEAVVAARNDVQLFGGGGAVDNLPCLAKRHDFVLLPVDDEERPLRQAAGVGQQIETVEVAEKVRRKAKVAEFVGEVQGFPVGEAGVSFPEGKAEGFVQVVGGRPQAQSDDEGIGGGDGEGSAAAHAAAEKDDPAAEIMPTEVDYCAELADLGR